MECGFNSFGYALRIPGESKINLIPRNNETSWLTKYLRQYKGKGIVEINGQKYEIGRWIRNLYFSGVAFTENPANPESILFEDYISHASISQDENLINMCSDRKFNTSIKSCVLNLETTKVNLWPK
jgi:hypothetical protein